MDEHLQKTLEHAQRKLAEQENAVVSTKKLINQLCEFGGIAPVFPNIEQPSGGSGVGTISRDSFYGKSATTAAREYLDMRRASGMGAATYEEIIEALKSGGFDFTSLNEDRTVAERTVSITMGKNSSIFHKLPNGTWGLLAWYPEAKEKKKLKAEAVPSAPPASSDPGQEAKTA